MKEWTLDELRQHIGEYVTTARWRTPAEVACYGGQGQEGGAGILAAVHEAPAVCRFGGVVDDFGVQPMIEVDYGMGWPVIPGTIVTFGEDQDARELLGDEPEVTA